jgi:GNAT superfamily N-acetyltransferase
MQTRAININNKKDLQGLTDLMNQWDDVSAVPYAQIKKQLKKSLARKNAAVFLCLDRDTYCGYVHVVECNFLAFDSFLEVQSILVDKRYRHRGVGKHLMKQAEAWAKAKGIKTVALSSRIKLKSAHLFYKKLGYKKYKESYFFKKNLG